MDRRLLRVRRLLQSGVAIGIVFVLAPCGFAGDDVPETIERVVNEAVDQANTRLQDGADVARRITMKTLGGRQFWGDVLFFHDWRIQENTFTGHYRLLDGADVRYAAGSLEKCKRTLGEIRKERKLEPMSGKAVILLHGIIRSSKSMAAMRKPFEEAGYRVFSFDYASTQTSILTAADHLHQVVASLEGVEEVNFVVHSMGGLVVRAMLAKHKDKRIKRLVMLGVPNNGAALADLLKKYRAYSLLFGPAGQELVSDPKGLIAQLPTPDFEFAVIAGGKGTLHGYNPLVPGDDDGTVGVASTRLPGAADFMLVHSIHSFLMYRAESVDAAVRFIKTGRLREEGEPRPILRKKTSEHVPSLPPA
ncbi:MAG: hypothetical protein CMJ48_06940 [Planctomycetaceae bacterium]|nr:hypothetical protein [Planctomycetaceae bacterium]